MFVQCFWCDCQNGSIAGINEYRIQRWRGDLTGCLIITFHVHVVVNAMSTNKQKRTYDFVQLYYSCWLQSDLCEQRRTIDNMERSSECRHETLQIQQQLCFRDNARDLLFPFLKGLVGSWQWTGCCALQANPLDVVITVGQASPKFPTPRIDSDVLSRDAIHLMTAHYIHDFGIVEADNIGGVSMQKVPRFYHGSVLRWS